jgi:hypothetical protein
MIPISPTVSRNARNAPPVAGCALKWIQPPNEKVTGAIFTNAGVFYPGISFCIPITAIESE